MTHIRYEHADGGSETFATVASSGYAERFFAGEVAGTPLKRIVALDSNGKIVAERTDVTTM